MVSKLLISLCLIGLLVLIIGNYMVTTLTTNYRRTHDTPTQTTVLSGDQGDVLNTGVIRKTSQIDWNARFRFVPNNVEDCKELFNGNLNISTELQNALNSYGQEIKERIKERGEGSTIESFIAFKAYLEMASHPSVKTVCETGFNKGYSTFGWLNVNKNAHVYSFDIGAHQYARPMAKFLTESYPGRLDVIWGDSTKTVPQFHKDNPDVRCDLVIIDGGHTTSVCKADLVNFGEMASDDSVVILDNYPQAGWGFMKKLGDCWEWAKRNGKVQEVFNCHMVDPVPHGFGFSLARYPRRY